MLKKFILYVSAASTLVPAYSMAGDAPEISIQTESHSTTLLQACQRHFGANRLTTGKGGTAFICYKNVLAEYPYNAEAKDGLKQIEARYEKWIKNALRTDLSKAGKYLIRLETVNPNSLVLLDLKRRFRELEDKARRRRLSRWDKKWDKQLGDMKDYLARSDQIIASLGTEIRSLNQQLLNCRQTPAKCPVSCNSELREINLLKNKLIGCMTQPPVEPPIESTELASLKKCEKDAKNFEIAVPCYLKFLENATVEQHKQQLENIGAKCAQAEGRVSVLENAVVCLKIIGDIFGSAHENLPQSMAKLCDKYYKVKAYTNKEDTDEDVNGITFTNKEGQVTVKIGTALDCYHELAEYPEEDYQKTVYGLADIERRYADRAQSILKQQNQVTNPSPLEGQKLVWLEKDIAGLEKMAVAEKGEIPEKLPDFKEQLCNNYKNASQEDKFETCQKELKKLQECVNFSEIYKNNHSPENKEKVKTCKRQLGKLQELQK